MCLYITSSIIKGHVLNLALFICWRWHASGSDLIAKLFGHLKNSIFQSGGHPWIEVFVSLFQNTRPSAENLPEDLAVIVTSCWKEDPNDRPNFSQIIQMLMHYLSTISPLQPAIPPRIFTSENAVLPPESPGTSTLMGVRDDAGDTPKTPMENEPRAGYFFCFNQCF